MLDKIAKEALNAKSVEIQHKIRKEKERVERSMREGVKYFVDASKRTFVSKGWGWEDWISNTDLYCGKRLFIKKGKRCSFHYHKVKDETFSIISGKMHLYYSEQDDFEKVCEIILFPGDAFHIPPGLRHQFVGLLDTEFIEFSTKHDDADTVRVIKGD